MAYLINGTEKMDIHMLNNEIGSLPLAIYQNQYKMYQTLKLAT